MATNDTSDRSGDKFLDALQLLIQQQADAESRREAAHAQCLAAFENLNARLQELSTRLSQWERAPKPREPATISPPKPTPHPNPGPPATANGSRARYDAAPSEPLSEWEKQKRALLQGFDLEDADARQTSAPTLANSAAEVAPPEPAVEPIAKIETIFHDWIEHFDPNDPALADDGERKNLIYRLRRLEVDLSLERAKLARERTELESKISEWERSERKKTDDSGDGKDRPKKDRLFRFLGKPGQ